MDNENKIIKLWHCLNIQDDELLIVQYYNQSIDADEYAVATKNNEKIEIKTLNIFPELSVKQPFHLFQHIGSNGKHIIPSVEQLERDKDMDY